MRFRQRLKIILSNNVLQVGKEAPGTVRVFSFKHAPPAPTARQNVFACAHAFRVNDQYRRDTHRNQSKRTPTSSQYEQKTDSAG